VLAFRDVTKIYKPSDQAAVTAVDGVTMTVDRGEFVAVLGRSGSGKTTLLSLAAGLTRPTRGAVLFEGVDPWTLPDRERSLLRNQRTGFVFQFPSLLPALTALENVVLPTTFGPRGQSGRARERGEELLARVGLGDRRAALPRQLSAGQQQRVVIARALVNEPEILLADEATTGLDEQSEAEIMALIREIHGHGGLTVVLVTHARHLVTQGARVVEMANGRLSSAEEPADPP